MATKGQKFIKVRDDVKRQILNEYYDGNGGTHLLGINDFIHDCEFNGWLVTPIIYEKYVQFIIYLIKKSNLSKSIYS